MFGGKKRTKTRLYVKDFVFPRLVFQYKGRYWWGEQRWSGAVLVMKEEKPTDVGTLGENNSRVCKLSSLTNASVAFSTPPTPLRATSHHRPTPITGYKQRHDLSRVLCLSVHKVTRVIQGILATTVQQPHGNVPGAGVQPITGRDAVRDMERLAN